MPSQPILDIVTSLLSICGSICGEILLICGSRIHARMKTRSKAHQNFEVLRKGPSHQGCKLKTIVRKHVLRDTIISEDMFKKGCGSLEFHRESRKGDKYNPHWNLSTMVRIVVYPF